jgi:hypothetical protein
MSSIPRTHCDRRRPARLPRSPSWTARRSQGLPWGRDPSHCRRTAPAELARPVLGSDTTRSGSSTPRLRPDPPRSRRARVHGQHRSALLSPSPSGTSSFQEPGLDPAHARVAELTSEGAVLEGPVGDGRAVRLVHRHRLKCRRPPRRGASASEATAALARVAGEGRFGGGATYLHSAYMLVAYKMASRKPPGNQRRAPGRPGRQRGRVPQRLRSEPVRAPLGGGRRGAAHGVDEKLHTSWCVARSIRTADASPCLVGSSACASR